MASSLPQDTWVNTFEGAPPRQILSKLQHRLQAASTHVQSLAELYSQRAIIEHEYAQKLEKLALTAESGVGALGVKGAVHWDKSSGEQKLFHTVVSDIKNAVHTHRTLSDQLKKDFVPPLRDFPHREAWQHASNQSNGLDRSLQQQEKTQEKYEKASRKTKSTKTEQLAADLAQWDSAVAEQAPKVYAAFQKLDEERLASLKEIIVRHATIRSDIAIADGTFAQNTLSDILSWEPADEVAAAALRMNPGGGERTSTASRARITSSVSSATPGRRMSAQPSTPSNPGGADFGPRMQRANGSNSNLGGGHSGFGGLKSMLSRKTTVRQRSGSEATTASARSRRPTDMFEPLGETEQIREDDVNGTPTRERRPSDRPRQIEPLVRPSGSGPAPPVDSEGYSVAPADRHRNPWDDNLEESAPNPSGVALPSALVAANQQQQQRSDSPVASFDQLSLTGSTSTADGARLNLGLTPDVIKESEEERQAALAKVHQTLSMGQAPVRRGTVARGRRAEARATMQSTSNGTPLPPNHMAALARIGQDDDRLSVNGSRRLSTSSSPSATTSRNPFEVPAGSPGLRSDVPPFQGASIDSIDQPFQSAKSSVSSPTGGIAAAAVAVPAMAAAGGGMFTSQPLSSEPTNIASPTTPQTLSAITTSPASPTFARPDTIGSPTARIAQVSAGPGLRAAIIETAHVYTGRLEATRIAIQGEIRLSLSPLPGQEPPAPGSAIHLRLTDFDALESIAPNPTFLAQVPDKPGEYYLNAEQLLHTSANMPATSLGATLFKYHVAVPPGSETAASPLLLNPAFQTKDGETRMILQYKAGAQAMADLSVGVTFPSEPSVSTTQSKPVQGTWGKANDGASPRITYTMASVPAGAESKIIARFVTDGGATKLQPKSVDAHFRVHDHLVSGIGIQVVDGEDPIALTGWKFDSVSRSTLSGKYVGEISLSS